MMTLTNNKRLFFVVIFLLLTMAAQVYGDNYHGTDSQEVGKTSAYSQPIDGGSSTPPDTGSGTNPGSNNGGGGGGGDWVNPDQEAYDDAQDQKDIAKDASGDVNDYDGSITAGAITGITEGLAGVDTAGAVLQADAAGDPVLVSTGKYVLDSEDIEIPGSGFAIKRKYLSEEGSVGSMGAGWLVSMDSRIIRGVTSIDATILAKMEKSLANIQAAYNAINKTFTRSKVVATEVNEKYLIPAQTKVNNWKTVKTRSQTLGALNAHSLFSGAASYYEKVGNEKLVLIDEGGAPKVFEPGSEAGVWVPMNNPEKMYERLETVDSGGAESTAGFVLYTKGGVKKQYDGYGMLTAVSELNGNRVDLERDGNGRVTRISGPHGNEWSISYGGGFIEAISGPGGREARYGYSGNVLGWVKDTDGDTVNYEYEGGRLKAIVKPDLSKIELTYGYIGGGGTQLVTATTNEEGASERFEYSAGLRQTTHTNHSGVVVIYQYDANHRTVQETHSDGTVKSYSYNTYGQLESETENGFTTTYSYNGRGNITEKSYSDGKSEAYSWNENDQMTKYVDVDGVYMQWTYSSGNCTEITRGGEVIYTASYDWQNRLIASKEGNRETVTYEYNSHDYVSERKAVIQGQEIKEQWEYDALGRVVKYTDGLKREWRYTYFAKETIETTPTGLEKRYKYDNRKDLVEIVEKDTKGGEERKQTIEYDRRHLPIKVKDGRGEVTEYQYRGDGEMTRKAQGAWYWEYRYDGGGRMWKVTRGKSGSSETHEEEYKYVLGTGGTEARTVTRPLEGTTTYQMNPGGHVTGVTNALGETSSREVNGAGKVAREQGASGGYYTYSYDTLGRVIEAGREGERAVKVNYNLDGSVSEKTDRLGNSTRYEYDGRGLLTKEKRELGEERYSYDKGGRVTRRETAGKNHAAYNTVWVYDDAQRTVTVSTGGVYIETLYLNAWGEVTRLVDGEGNETKYEYDGAGKLVKAIDGYGRVTSYKWNALGKVEVITRADLTKESYEYDHIGNVTKIQDSLGIAWTGVYDEAGRLSKETGRPGIEKEYKYDVLGRIVEVKSGGEAVERYSYTNRGLEVVFTDGEGKKFTQEKNRYGELEDERNRLSGTQRYSYDAEGRITSTVAYSGKQTKVEYLDNEGITVTGYSDGTQSIIERDLSGNIVRATNESGTVRYRYDGGGKLVEQNDEGAGEVTKYSYNRAGLRIRMQSGNRDVQYRYGKNGELLKVTDNSQRLEVSYEYDVMGRETRRVYGNGVRQETQYDVIGRVVMIRESDSGNRLLRAEGYLYDDKGRRSCSVNEEGLVTKYEYDKQSRLQTVLYPWTKEKAESDRKEAEQAGLFFTVDKGNGERHSHGAAELVQLREVLNKAGPARGNAISGNQMVWRESYSYDRNGNRSGKTTPWGTIKYEYDGENRLVKKGDIVYTNDKDGNTLSEKGLRYEASYQYNGRNRMVYSEVVNHLERTREAAWYRYDGLGRRVTTQNTTGQALRTLYDGKGFEVIREGETYRDGSLTTRYASSNPLANAQTSQGTGERYRWISDGSSTRTTTDENNYTMQQETRYGGRGVTLYGRGEAVAVSYSSSSGGTRSMYLGKDIMGSVRSVTVDTGAIEERHEYDAFGQPYKGDLSGGMNLGYTGKPYNTTTGLYNYGYRDYQPQAARFTTIDPIRDGSNWFSYVNNDPVNYVDMWGLESKDKKDDPSTVLAKVVNGVAYPLGLSSDDFTGDLVTSPWGDRPSINTQLGPTNEGHGGIDLQATVGTRVNAAGNGTVVTVGNDPNSGLGNYVIINHPDGTNTLYAHLNNSYVKEKQEVKAGQHIANSGNTGKSKGPHLHFGYDGNKDGAFSSNNPADNPNTLLFSGRGW